ncbi:MAG: S-layer homology domain-containing protein [Oscillospiraceae bacterium]|nr:S-layer homology domain-containing protein [Oscillospiraceae bacterium]
MESALVGGPVLVKGGKKVVDDSNNQSFYSDPKQKPNYSAARAFVGITGNGSLVLGTVTGTFSQIADWMVSIGIQEGIAMDGGASSMLYANGTYVTPAGRDLASALTIVDRTGNGGLPAECNKGNPDADTPDPWAVESISSAIAAGLVPERVQKNYKENITRQDFCLMIWPLITKQPDYFSKLYPTPEVSFSDVNHFDGSGEWIQWVARLGIVQGIGDGKFAPYAELTREQAAKILALTAQFLGVEDTGAQSAFPDRDSCSGWAQEYVDFCGVNKILNGKDGGNFDPAGKFTYQEAIATICRIYNQYSAK